MFPIRIRITWNVVICNKMWKRRKHFHLHNDHYIGWYGQFGVGHSDGGLYPRGLYITLQSRMWVDPMLENPHRKDTSSYIFQSAPINNLPICLIYYMVLFMEPYCTLLLLLMLMLLLLPIIIEIYVKCRHFIPLLAPSEPHFLYQILMAHSVRLEVERHCRVRHNKWNRIFVFKHFLPNIFFQLQHSYSVYHKSYQL